MGQLECIDLVRQATDFLDGSLDTEVWRRLDAHVGACWACVHYLGEITVTVRLMSELPPERLTSSLESTLLAMFRSELRSPRLLD